MAKFNINTSPKYTGLEIKGEASALDIILAICVLFDRLSPDSKELALKKLEKVKGYEEGQILNSDE